MDGFLPASFRRFLLDVFVTPKRFPHRVTCLNLKCVWIVRKRNGKWKTCIWCFLWVSRNKTSEQYVYHIRLGQTTYTCLGLKSVSHVVASSGKLNLRRGLRWAAKQTDRQVSSQVHASCKKKTIWRQTFPVFHWLIINGRDLTCVDLDWLAKRRKPCFDLRANLISTKVSASHRKSTQVHARLGQAESQVEPGF